MASLINIRKIALEDVPAICRIYNYYIEHTVITFETSPVSENEMSQRVKSIISDGFPYYVATINDKIAGYYYLNNWNNRCAYALTKEVTVYLDKECTGNGLGTLLYQHLFENLDKEKVHVLIAGICIPNEKSVRLHEKFGFKQVSNMKEIGRKFDEWRDVGHWQLVMT
ncbi:MAG: GNAT family N-acetyltransferase [Bacteroidales bacterium]|jgi:phosphinothricin acetyltransferase|nr:GNAT family N-acetyltransferase [Bacteroidales bacterium]